MAPHPLAGHPAPAELLVDVGRLERLYYEGRPDPDDPAAARELRHQRASRLAAGRELHRGAHPGHQPGDRRVPPRARHHGPLYPGQGHARRLASRRAHRARGAGRERRHDRGAAETTASRRHPPSRTPSSRTTPAGARGSPMASSLRRRTILRPTAASNTTRPTAARPTPKSRRGSRIGPTRCSPGKTPACGGCRLERARAAATTHEARSASSPTWRRSSDAIDLDAVRAGGLELGVDPLGGASLAYWPRIAERYGLDLTVVNPALDPTFAFMPVDHDGKIRMDCSSPWAMAGLVRAQGPVRGGAGATTRMPTATAS